MISFKNNTNILAISTAIMLCFALPSGAQEVEVFDKAASSPLENWATGPKIGERVPDFQAMNLNGKLRSLNDIKGPNGTYIVFFRSADW